MDTITEDDYDDHHDESGIRNLFQKENDCEKGADERSKERKDHNEKYRADVDAIPFESEGLEKAVATRDDKMMEKEERLTVSPDNVERSWERLIIQEKYGQSIDDESEKKAIVIEDQPMDNMVFESNEDGDNKEKPSEVEISYVDAHE